MSPGVRFVLSLAATLVLLGAVVFTGFKARRRMHISLVLATLASLGATIFLAIELGELYDLESAGLIYPVHRALALTAVVSFLLPVSTGLWTLRDASRRKLHRVAALVALTLTVATAVTGVWMISVSERL